MECSGLYEVDGVYDLYYSCHVHLAELEDATKISTTVGDDEEMVMATVGEIVARYPTLERHRAIIAWSDGVAKEVLGNG